MSSELRGLLDNEDADEEEVPFTGSSESSRRETLEDFQTSKEGNVITRNKKTSLFLAASIALVLVICGIVIFLIVRNSDKDIERNVVVCQPMDFGAHDNNTIVTPLNDHSSYKVLTLSNQLRVVLISDPNATQSAAAIDVNAGSLNDPAGVDGLAHFCEHMLFLGTRKYPDKSEYSNFLSANGGYDNAYTSSENTNYYFAVNLDALEEALDRFAQFFIAPLFLENSTYAEMNAVNSEYDKDLNDPGWKFYQLLKNVSNPQHPFSRFSIGSIGTLNISDIRQRLIKYYNTSYSANQMQLAVIGKDSLSTLESWVRSKFSSIPNRHLEPLQFNSTSFPPEYATKLIYYAPGEPEHSVTIIWQIQSLENKYRNHVASLLSRYLGDESHGSVLEQLKMKLWASSLSASTEVGTASFTLYAVSIVLTEEGLVHVKDVVAMVFQYIRILMSVTDDQWCNMWNEYIESSNILFNHRDKSKPYNFVSGLAASMRTIKYPADFLSPPSRAVFNMDLINSTLNKLTPSNSVVFVGSPDFLKDTPTNPQGLPRPNLDSVEPWFNTSFTKVDIPREVLDSWSVDDNTIKLSLPSQNNFIPKKLEIHPLGNDHSDMPTQISNDNGLSIWWLQDDQFFTPKINLVCSLETPVAYSSSRNYALTNMFLNYVAQTLKADLYPASLTGYSMSLDYNPSGVVIRVNGYSDEDVMEQYLTVLLQGISRAATGSVDENVYTVTLKSLMSYYEDYSYDQLPYHYVRSYTQYVILQRPYFKHSTILSQLNNITSGEMLQHAKNLFKSFNTTCFIHGNVLKAKATSYAGQVKRMLSQSTTTVQQSFCSKQIVKLDNGLSSVTIRPLNPTDKNSVVNVIFQIGRSCIVQNNKCSNSSLRNYVLSGLLQLIMKDHCFSYLRTVKQLGYVATCYAAAHSDVLSFELLVQSGTYNPDHILNVMEEFLNDFYDNNLVQLTEDTFNDIKSSYIKVINQKKLTLKDKTNFLWNYIAVKSYQFDIHSQATKVVRSITGGDLRSFYNDNLLQMSHRKMVISIFGYPKVPHHYIDNATEVNYDKIENFKSSASFFETVGC